MGELRVGHAEGRDALLAALAAFEAAVATLDDHALLAASRCHGWGRVEVVVHVRTGLQELLGGVVATTGRAPDVDAAGYWAAWAPADEVSDEVDAILWTRRTASAHRRPSGSREHLAMAADALRAAVPALVPGAVAFQGHVLTTGDLLATWAVELAVHHLDLDLPGAPPDPAALRLSRRTVEALLDAPLPAAWSDERCVLLGTGRARPGAAERRALGPLAERVAVLG